MYRLGQRVRCAAQRSTTRAALSIARSHEWPSDTKRVPVSRSAPAHAFPYTACKEHAPHPWAKVMRQCDGGDPV
eukprot:5687757-Pleurochrysis_carterae.AAC.3